MKIFYQCERCTACCRWPGDVAVTEADVSAISQFLGMMESDFVQQHTRIGHRRQGLSLLEREDGACVWLDGKDCALQSVKPEQCRGFPNQWFFPGWREMCQARPVVISEEDPRAAQTRHEHDPSVPSVS